MKRKKLLVKIHKMAQPFYFFKIIPSTARPGLHLAGHHTWG